MEQTFRATLAGALCPGFALPSPGKAAPPNPQALKAGEVLGVSEDLVLAGDDVLLVQGSAEKPCRLDGNGQQLRTADGWRGRIEIRHCEFRGLGSASKPALDLTAAGEGDQIVIE